MKKIFLFFILILLSACSRTEKPIGNSAPGDELLGSWINNGTYYAGSRIVGSTTLIFKSDKTFVALEKAKGMPTITENGLWQIKGDTLKIKYNDSPVYRPDIVTYAERNGGAKDFLKPVSDDTARLITWNYKINGNKLLLDGSLNGYSGPNELLKD